MACELCKGTGWVCENHLGQPWEFKDADGVWQSKTCCDGAGTNCVCNPSGDYEFAAVYASTEPEKVKVWVQ